MPTKREGGGGGKHTRGTPPLVRGGLGGPPPLEILFLALLCAFLMRFMRLGPGFSHDFFARKDISWRVRKPNAKQNRFLIVMIFFTFFFSIFLRHYVTYVPVGIGKVLLALILGCHDSWADPEGGAGGPDPPEKSQKK